MTIIQAPLEFPTRDKKTFPFICMIISIGNNDFRKFTISQGNILFCDIVQQNRALIYGFYSRCIRYA